MKVLLDLQYLNVATSGIKTYMMELAKAADQTFKNPQSKIQRLNYHMDYFLWKEFQLPDLVKKHQPDVLICPDFVSPAASLPCRRLTVIHDAFFWQMPKNYPKWWRTYFLNLLKKGLKEQTEIITTTEYSKQALKKYLRGKFPVTVIYQSPKTLADRRDSGYLQESGFREKSYFLHIGTFDKRKNLPLLVKAYADFLKETGSDFQLILAGGPGQSRQMNDFPIVEELVKTLGLEGKVILPGYLSDSQVKALYAGAFAYVFPSENEGFGIPIVEAMGYGLPVIHSDQPALLEVAGGAGLASKTGDQKDLAKKMILLTRENKLREDLIRKGTERSEDFSPKKFIDSFHQIILSTRN